MIALGDSSGCGLILEMLFITHDPSMFEVFRDDASNQQPAAAAVPELPRPASLVLSSPLVTDKTTSESWKTNVKYDYITQLTAKRIIEDYFEEQQTSSSSSAEQQLSGIDRLQTGFRAFLPRRTLMFVDNKETLCDDASKAKQDGVVWETVMEDCVHDWFFVREVVKDKSIFERVDAVFADFCYKTVVEPQRAYRRQGERLAAVPEEEDDSASDEEFHDAVGMDLPSMTSSSSTTISLKKRSDKRVMANYV